MANVFSDEEIYLYVQNGGNLNLMKNYTFLRETDIPQEYINKRAENGYSLDGFKIYQVANIPQNCVNSYASKGGNEIQAFTVNQIKNIPQNIINKRAEKGCYMGHFELNQIKHVPQDYINKRAEKGYYLGHFTHAQIKKIPKEYINRRVENGFSLEEFSKIQIAKISQDSINKCAENGFSLEYFSKKQIANIPQEFINRYIAKGGDLFSLTRNQLLQTPKYVFYEFIANGGDLYVFKSNIFKDIIDIDLQDQNLQEYFNRRAENGYEMDKLSNDQIANIPQDSFDKYLEKGGNKFDNFTNDQLLKSNAVSLNKYFSNCSSSFFFANMQEKISPVISKTILYPTDKGKQALILYTIDMMKAKDLPVDVFVNYKLRNEFLRILKTKAVTKFNQICEEKGYVNSVPPKVQKAFDEKLQSFYTYAERRKEEGLKQLSDMSEKKLLEMKSEEEKLSQNSLNFINNWEM